MTRTPAAWLLLTLSVLVAGCGGRKTVPQEQLDRGREAVTTALEAWKKGDRPEALKKLDPPIEITDELWQDRWRLLNYEITDVYGQDDLRPRCAVMLTLKDQTGKTVRRGVVYQIVTSPKLQIARDPFQ